MIDNDLYDFYSSLYIYSLISEPSRIHRTRETAATNSSIAKRRDFERRRRDIVPRTRGCREGFYTLLHG